MLHIVKTLIAFLAKVVDAFGIAHVVVLPPVVSELQLCQLRVSILAHAIVSDNERHIAAVLAE